MNKKTIVSFTLVEVLIVVVIIGILSAIAVPSYRKATERARQAEGVHLLGILREAQLRYYSQFGGFISGVAGIENINNILDVELTTPKYFAGVSLIVFGSVDDPIIAEVGRDEKIQNVGYGNYIIRVSKQGVYGYFGPLEGPGGLP